MAVTTKNTYIYISILYIFVFILSLSSKSTDPKVLTVLSWNIDGLDEREIGVRALAVSDVINKHEPHVVLLQEVVDKNLIMLQMLCPRYILFCY